MVVENFSSPQYKIDDPRAPQYNFSSFFSRLFSFFFQFVRETRSRNMFEITLISISSFTNLDCSRSSFATLRELGNHNFFPKYLEPSLHWRPLFRVNRSYGDSTNNGEQSNDTIQYNLMDNRRTERMKNIPTFPSSRNK